MDRLTPDQRHKNMAAIKNKNSEIECILRKILWDNGYRYRKNCLKVYGKPDICFPSKKIAIFCDSEFWHGYNWKEQKKTIHSNQSFWLKKIERNMERDEEVNKKLEKDGWIVLRFWGNVIKKDPMSCLYKIQKVLERGKNGL